MVSTIKTFLIFILAALINRQPLDMQPYQFSSEFSDTNQVDCSSGCIEFYQIANKAYCLLQSGDTIQASSFYSEAFSLRKYGCAVSELRNDMYLYAKCLLKTNNELLATNYLSSAVSKTGITLRQIESDDLREQYVNFELYDSFVNHYDSLHAIWMGSLDLELRSLVDSLVVRDQFFREEALYRPSESDSLRLLQKDYDWQNEMRIGQIIGEKGFPGYASIGTNDAYILFLHTSWGFRDSIFPVLMGEIDMGRCSPSLVASMIDQMMYYKSKEQRYGTGMIINELGYSEYLPFEENDIDKINFNRTRIGLTNLECHMKENEIELPYFFDK